MLSSTTGSECITLSQYTEDTISIMGLIVELSTALTVLTKSKIRCTLFEDNNGCIELIECLRMKPQINYIDLKYHHFRLNVKERLVIIKRIANKMQRAAMLANAREELQFKHIRTLISGW